MKTKTFLSITLSLTISLLYFGTVKATETSESASSTTTAATTSTTTATKTKTSTSAKATATTEASESPEATKTSKTTSSAKRVEKTEVETEKEVEDSYSEYKTAKSADKLAKAQAVGIKLIDKRINTLNNFADKQFKGLTTAQLTAVKAQVKTYTDALTELKAKIQADTTVEAVKTDVASVYSDYHVYQVLIPLLHLTNALNQSQAILDKLNALTVRLTTTITTQTAVGKDTAALTVALNDYKAQIVDATSQLASAKTEVAKIDIKNADTSKTAITAALSYLAKFKADTVAAKGDLATFKSALATTSSVSATSATTTATTVTATGE